MTLLLLWPFDCLLPDQAGPTSRHGLHLARGFMGFVTMVLYVWAITRIDLGLASALNQSNPIYIVLLSIPLLGERPGWRRIALAVLGLGGVWLILSPDLSGLDLQAVPAAVSGLTAALAYLAVRPLSAQNSPRVIFRWFIIWNGVLSLPLLLLPGWGGAGLVSWSWLVGLSLAGFAGHWFLTRAYVAAPASLVGPFLYLTVAANLAVGWLVWGERPGFGALAGVALVVVACVLVARQGTQQ